MVNLSIASSCFVFDAAFRERRSYPGDHHVCGAKPFHHRNTFDNNFIFFPYVSTVIKLSGRTSLNILEDVVNK